MAESQQSKRYGLSSVEELLERLPIPLAIIIAEEIREGVTEKLKDLKAFEATKSVVVKDKLVDRLFEFLTVEGRGRIRELTLVLDKPDFEIYVEADGRAVINHSFSELSQLSEVMEEVDALQTNGYYVFRISNISFLSNCKVILKPQKPVTVKNGLALYNVV